MELKETEKRLLEAVSKIIEEEGFTQIGINRIAKKAQCDKVLIYRYFGGLDGLLAAWAKQYDFYSFARSEERRVGKECSEPCRSRWSPYH